MKSSEVELQGSDFLITGGAGFIGVNLIRTLLPIKGKLRVLDNLSSSDSRDLDSLPVDLAVADIRDRQAVDEAVAGTKVVIHLAAHTGVADSVTDPATDMSINVMGTLNLLEAAVRHKVERFIFASTGGAIVGNVVPPVHEKMSPQPVSPYGASKLAGEGYCSAFWGSYGLKTIPLRFSNIYGPFSYHKGSVVAKFFRQIKASKQLGIFGDGEQTRDFLFVQDVCQAIVAAIQAEVPFGQPIQLGTGRETSVNQLVDLMRQTVEDSNFPPIQYFPARPGEVLRNFVATARAGKYLGFSPQIDLLHGLKQTWEWFQEMP